MRYNTRLRVARAAIAAAAGLFAFGASSPGSAQGPALQRWRHAIIEPKGDAGFQVMAVRAGFVAKQGLKLELPYFQNDVIALRALFAGELESYEGGAAAANIAAPRQAQLKIHGCHWPDGGDRVFARAEFKGPPGIK